MNPRNTAIKASRVEGKASRRQQRRLPYEIYLYRNIRTK